ncbi:MAG: hypothetical protein KC438_06225, partial [Thermomicrobiales bacterium]|nr:hypothetical protein [Thermomicrobiales bacterium]
MDGTRFDNLARRFSRRKAVGAAGAAGLATAMAKVLPSHAQGGDVTCQMSIQALTSAGPSFDILYSGVLEITIAEDGGIDSGSFTPVGGVSVPVVGEVDGRALDLRVMFPTGQHLVLSGTGENDIETCSGALSGVFGGPELGDTGSWLIDPSQSQLIDNGSGGFATATATSVAGATATPACPEIDCGSTHVLDPTTCQCGCPAPTEACGPVCCPAGSVCTDEVNGNCTCPDGTELCGDSCVESCPMGSYLDYETCHCTEGCGLTSCPEGQVLDSDQCICADICFGGTPYYCGGNCYAEQHYQCSGVCYSAVSLNSNAQMCGPSCQACPQGVPCIAGSCQCPFGYSYCQGLGCVDLASD